VTGRDQPIGPGKRDHLLRDVTLPVAIAVSGGADSMALMHMVAGWAAGRDGHVPPGVAPVLVITVDHGLRPESAEEAEWVGEQARKLGLEHVVLRWTGDKPRTGIQEAARGARYELICRHVGSEPLSKPRQVLLAHHLDDQAETVLMRLARGSGVDGLSGMRDIETRVWLKSGHPVEERLITFHRPLLTIEGVRLRLTLAELGGEFRHDPSNDDPRHERVRVRRAVATRGDLGLTSRALATTAARMAASRAALDAAQHVLARTAVDLHGGAWASLDLAALAGAPWEVIVRLLRSVIMAMGGQDEPPERTQLEELANRLGDLNGHARTLGGTVISIRHVKGADRVSSRAVVAIYREQGRQPLPEITLKPGTGAFWDRRFYVSADASLGYEVRIAPLGQAGFARLKQEFAEVAATGFPSRAAATLPSFWHGSDLVAVPHLSAAVPALAPPVREGEPLLVANFADQHVRSIMGVMR
jgi:tRNA(Ile)-lysidine synthase